MDFNILSDVGGGRLFSSCILTSCQIGGGGGGGGAVSSWILTSCQMWGVGWSAPGF